MAGTGVSPNGQATYDESAAAATGDRVLPGWTLMGEFLQVR